ncbi:MAG: PIN domain-containing protein [Candidatus Accumulibacter sp.]|jgi:toxin-antitoxin system PIN domain toxin|nr:PIN domain-containing protein [Accumulibacter sp.]
MIALDTNLLVYMHRRDSPFHAAAKRTVSLLAEGKANWAIPWPCLHEFFAIVTHPRVFSPPSMVDEAIAQIDAWMESPTLPLLSEDETHWPRLRDLIGKAKLQGPMVHDVRIAALCLSHGIHELWSADRDFSRFPALRVRNPLI